jgi:hypothetical protein
MVGRYVCVLFALASLLRGSDSASLSLSSTRESFPFCSPGNSECILKSTPAGDVWLPYVRPTLFPDTAQAPFTAAGFDSTTPCPKTSLYNSGINPQLIENQVRFRCFPQNQRITKQTTDISATTVL